MLRRPPPFLPPPKHKLFVSYHHGGDSAYYDEVRRLFCDTYDVVQDNSVDRLIDSDNAEYVIRTIREDYISGSSCTVVLCGAQTPWRKFVDWEIKATLDKDHGLIGVGLPSAPKRVNASGQTVTLVPDRLADNIDSGYALWTTWNSEAFRCLPLTVELANGRSKRLVRNFRDLRLRNG